MCRDCGDTGDIYGFIGVSNWLFVIPDYLLDGDHCCAVDTSVLACFALQNKSMHHKERQGCD